MKSVMIVAVVIVVFAAGAGGAYLALSSMRSGGNAGSAPTRSEPAAIQTPADHNEHGKSVAIPENAVICPEHHVPEVICPFCNPALIAELGHCGEHDVAEALCTRCNPVLIAAFKAENDWCAEHGLPESQCLICKGEAGGG